MELNGEREGSRKKRADWNRDRTINSIVLLSNGISFAIQIVVFLFLGSFAGISHEILFGTAS